MAPGISAVPEPTLGRMRLQITGGTGPVTVTMTAPNIGLTYTVRGTPTTTTAAFYDTDAPLNTSLQYVATDSTGSSGPATGPLVSNVAWLQSMTRPEEFTAHPEVLADRSRTWEGRSVAHDILGTPGPLVTTQVAAFRTGTLEFIGNGSYDGKIAWTELRNVLLCGDALLLRVPCYDELPDTAFITESVVEEYAYNQSRSPSPPGRSRMVTVDYRAVRRDATAPRPVSWTFDDVKATYTTFNAVRTAYPTFDQLTVGPSIPGTTALDATVLAATPLGW